MDNTNSAFDIYNDIKNRTSGNIYLGVVGPVRTGKSSFIRRFTDLMVLPFVNDALQAARIRDELPQSGTGRTVMTTEPKFIPAEAVTLHLDDAYMAGLPQVTVIHGRGTGTLRRGLQQLFRKHAHVDSFAPGSFYEGGEGVTVVDLKQ